MSAKTPRSLNWRRLHIFKAVADAGSLSGAARSLNLSQTTVGRQIEALEREIGTALFRQGDRRQELTIAGSELLPLVTDMGDAAKGVERLIKRHVERGPVVHISCGPWMGMHLARNVDQLTGRVAELTLRISTHYSFADVGRREADIALRNKRPVRGKVVRRLCARYAYAPYGSFDYVRANPASLTEDRFRSCTWTCLDEAASHFPSMRWLLERLNVRPRYCFSTSTNILQAVKNGAGLGVMPCYIGDREDGLRRVGLPFIPDSDGLWMVVNEDLRHAPSVRDVVEQLSQMFRAQKDLFAGASR